MTHAWHHRTPSIAKSMAVHGVHHMVRISCTVAHLLMDGIQDYTASCGAARAP